jgi:hypothetical protein
MKEFSLTKFFRKPKGSDGLTVKLIALTYYYRNSPVARSQKGSGVRGFWGGMRRPRRGIRF